ncbi:hypothetical protein TorRG33x02_027120 [Trema orientale]|uniref:Uncharacterized protein n=1 Tax=Trema orientale TaxID=63057 RepID=A0A2P5FUE0_TREOI|nr:hypothetical protein TorRG33x02_027120 [Trema orientale]
MYEFQFVLYSNCQPSESSGGRKSVFEFKLHEVSGDGGDEYLGELAIDGVSELEDVVVARMLVPHSNPADFATDSFSATDFILRDRIF